MSVQQIEKETAAGPIAGFCDPRFSRVAEEFEKNFAERDEVGAAVCITHEGETVVDLWGGLTEPGGAAWEKDTLTVIFSCTKGAVATMAHILADRGKLDLAAPVADYWPEFATNGKEKSTVQMMLDHAVGVPAFHDPVKDGGCNDFDYMAERVAAEKPWWEPGTRNGYHMLTFGWTVGELIRRVSGKSLGTFFQDEIAKPLGLDFWIGMPEEHEPRVAPQIYWTPGPGDTLGEFATAMMTEPTSMQALSILNTGGFNANDPDCHRAEIGGGGGITNARGLAGLYAPLACGGELNGVRLVGAQQLKKMTQVSVATHRDATLLSPTRFASGYMKSMDNRRRAFGDRYSAIFGPEAFGHVGAGGHLGLAEPTEKMSFGYCMNKMGEGILLKERGQSLVDATYLSLGYTSNASGIWVK